MPDEPADTSQTQIAVPLLVVLLSLVVDDVEELELVHSLRSRDDAEPVTELHLLKELLGEILEVAAREVVVGNDLDLAIGGLGDLDVVAKVADAALNLDLLVEKFFEGGDVEDLVACGLRSVDDELRRIGQAALSGQHRHRERTFLVTFGPLDFFCNSK
jgi:hypothetical protein